jgi:hypothetical protein
VTDAYKPRCGECIKASARSHVGHLIGILRDEREAVQAAQSLHAAGYPDVVVLAGQAALQAVETRERRANPLARAWTRLSAYLDDPDGRRDVLEALGQGHAIVLVQASVGAQKNQAGRILRAHGAHALRSFGRWTITDVSG